MTMYILLQQLKHRFSRLNTTDSTKRERMTGGVAEVLPQWHVGCNFVVKMLICLETPH